jgi:hypothetical protein
MSRAVKAARLAGGAGARVIVDLANRKLEILIGEAAMVETEPNPWDEDDA